MTATVQRERGRLWASLGAGEIVLEEVDAVFAGSGMLALTDRRLVFLSTPLRSSEALWVDLPLAALDTVRLAGPARAYRGAHLHVVARGQRRPLRFSTWGGGQRVAERFCTEIRDAAERVSRDAIHEFHGIVVPVEITRPAAARIADSGGRIWVAVDGHGVLHASVQEPYEDAARYVEQPAGAGVQVFVSEELVWCSRITIGTRGRLRTRLAAELRPAPFGTLTCR